LIWQFFEKLAEEGQFGPLFRCLRSEAD